MTVVALITAVDAVLLMCCTLSTSAKSTTRVLKANEDINRKNSYSSVCASATEHNPDLRGHAVVPAVHRHVCTHRVTQESHNPQPDWQHLDLRPHLCYLHAWTHMRGYP